MSNLRFACEGLSPHLLEEALPLLRAHWAEVAHYLDIPLEIDTDMYLGASVAGLVRCYTARADGESRWWLRQDGCEDRRCSAANGELLGYAVFFVRPNLHYKQSKQAVQDVVYLHPSVRGGTGVRFLAWCDERLAEEGVQVAYHHAKLAHGQLGGALEKLGYEPVETMYAKRLDTAAVETRATSVLLGATARVSESVTHPGSLPSPAATRIVGNRAFWRSIDETNDLARTSPHMGELANSPLAVITGGDEE